MFRSEAKMTLLDTCQQARRMARTARPRHPDTHVEKAVQHAEKCGWRVELSNGRALGICFVPAMLAMAAWSPFGRLRGMQKTTPGR